MSSDPTRRTLLAGTMLLSASAVAAVQGAPNPIEGDKGATILVPRDPARAAENPDLLTPPATDHGTIPNLRFSFTDTHVSGVA